jgi:uncharacterized protein
MDALKIPIATVTGPVLEVDAVVSGQELRPEGAAELALLLGDVTVKGTLKEISEDYLFQGTVSGTYMGSCDRCLEAVVAPFSIDVLWNFAQGAELEGLQEFMSAEGEPDDYEEMDPLRAFAGNEINLAGHVWEEIVLDMPPKVLCGPACKGLCPRCGANLNDGPCACKPGDEPEASKESRFADLRDLFPDLGRETPEE